MKNYRLITGEILAVIMAAALLWFWVTHRPPARPLVDIPPDIAATNAKDMAANGDADNRSGQLVSAVTVCSSVMHDESPSLSSLARDFESKDVSQSMAQSDEEDEGEAEEHENVVAPQQKAADAAGATTSRSAAITGVAAGSSTVEQTEQGTKPPPEIVASFDGLGEGFEGPQGTARGGNPSDNSLAVGPNHIVQIVNSRMAVFTKKGELFKETGRVLYGPVPTGNVFRGFFGNGLELNNGDAVVRYDQLADRWLIVMPIFRRLPPRDSEPAAPKAGEAAHESQKGVKGQPGEAAPLNQPGPRGADGGRGLGRGAGGFGRGQNAGGSYAMCYAISTGPDPLGSYYRYQFVRPLFPDYPRPAVWPDGYYVPTSTGDTVIQKQAFVVDRAKMLKGEDATEQGLIIDGVNFLNNSDVDGKRLPPPGAPNIMMAAGGTQLKGILEDDGIYYWKFHVDWNDPTKTKLEGPVKVSVVAVSLKKKGQLTRAVSQPGIDVHLDAQGDKIMQRLVYRRIGEQESIVAVHSVNTTAGGGVRWYEFRIGGPDRKVQLYQQGTYCPGGFYRWMASPAMDGEGNIGIGYSFGGAPNFAGQRFAGRNAKDPLGQLTLREVVLAEGEASQLSTNRWEDYAQTAVDPSDDMTIWYVGDYLKKGAASYSSRIGGFRIASSRDAK